MPTEIYLDHNATTPILPAAADAVRETMLAVHANATSQHAAGRAARRRLQEARDAVARLLGARMEGLDPDRLILTSGGTESNNLALRFKPASSEPSASAAGAKQSQDHVVLSSIEHPSITAAGRQLEAEGTEVSWAPVGRDGIVDIDALEKLLRPNTRLVSVMLANNETGIIQPVEQVVRICSSHAIAVHTDATQVVGKLPVDFRELGVTMMTLTAHKFHGPVGIGGLLVRGDAPLPALLAGQEGMDRPGTAAVALAAGMQVALEAFDVEHQQRQQRMTRLRERLEAKLLDTPRMQETQSQTILIGRQSPRLPHTTNIAFPGIDRQALVMALDRASIACSTGSACASGSSEPSPVLLAMGLPDEVVGSSIRLSLGAGTTEEEVDESARRIREVCQRMRGT